MYQNDDSNYIPNSIVYNVRGRPPKRLKSAVKITKNKRPLKEITNINQNIEQDSFNNSETSVTGVVHGRGQRKCRKCGELGYYQKNCNK